MVEKTCITCFTISSFGFYDMRVSNHIIILPLAPECPFMSDHFRKSWQRDKRKKKEKFEVSFLLLSRLQLFWLKSRFKKAQWTGHKVVIICLSCGCVSYSLIQTSAEKKLLLRHLYLYGLSIHSCFCIPFFCFCHCYLFSCLIACIICVDHLVLHSQVCVLCWFTI